MEETHHLLWWVDADLRSQHKNSTHMSYVKETWINSCSLRIYWACQLKNKNKTSTRSLTAAKVLIGVWRKKVWPSRSVHLRRVKQVHSVLVSYGHQVLSHLKGGRGTKIEILERETMDELQLPRGRPWRALCGEDNTADVISNISPHSYSFQVTALWDSETSL